MVRGLYNPEQCSGSDVAHSLPHDVSECDWCRSTVTRRGNLQRSSALSMTRKALTHDNDMKPAIDKLQQMPVFGGLTATTLGILQAHAQIVPRAPGQAYFEHGEEGDSLFVLLQGRAMAVLQTASLSYNLRPIGIGDSFGEAANIDLQPRSNTVFAQAPCIAIEIGPDELHRIWQHDLEQFTMLQMNISRELSRRLRDSDADRLTLWQSATACQ